MIVLESHGLGSGASSRNSGAVYARHVGISDPQMPERGLQRLRAFIDSEQIDCGFAPASTLTLLTSNRSAQDARSDLVPGARWISPEELRESIGSGYYAGAVDSPGYFCVQPAKLAVGHAKAALRVGAELFQHSPALSVESGRTALNGIPVAVEDQVKLLDDWGGPASYPHFQAGWAVATNTPFQWTKQVASHYGGTRNPLVIHWPEGIKAQGEIRSQWHHVTDIAPTVMEAAGLPFPNSVNGTIQKPFEGVSLIYAFDAPNAADRHTTQYFEMFGNRAIYNDGWVAATEHRTPWAAAPDGPFDEDKWELYHVAEDFSQANDLATKNPAKLKELQDLFMEEAIKYSVLPLDDRVFERFNAAIAGRPDLMGDRPAADRVDLAVESWRVSRRKRVRWDEQSFSDPLSGCGGRSGRYRRRAAAPPGTGGLPG